MSLESKYLEIQQFLSISDQNFKLPQKIDLYFDSIEIQIEIVGKILLFIHNFSMFSNVKPFMESLYKCIETTVEINRGNINDFNQLLIRNSLMQFMQSYLDYSRLSRKQHLLKIFSDSLDKLQIQPLIINLGLLLKPMYQDSEYLQKITQFNETEVIYALDNKVERSIKYDIDNWLHTTEITLENQNEVMQELLEYYEYLTEKSNISRESQEYISLRTEIVEMFSIKLTILSLMETFSDESTEPFPIK